MLETVAKPMSLLTRLLALLAGAALLGMVAVVVVDVIGRRIAPELSVRGAIELVTLLLVVTGFFGLPLACHQSRHLNVEVATAAAPEPVRRWLDGVWSLVGAGVLGFLCWMTFDAGLYLHSTGQVSEILRLSPLVSYGLAAVGLLVAALASLTAALRAVAGAKGSE